MKKYSTTLAQSTASLFSAKIYCGRLTTAPRGQGRTPWRVRLNDRLGPCCRHRATDCAEVPAALLHLPWSWSWLLIWGDVLFRRDAPSFCEVRDKEILVFSVTSECRKFLRRAPPFWTVIGRASARCSMARPAVFACPLAMTVAIGMRGSSGA